MLPLLSHVRFKCAGGKRDQAETVIPDHPDILVTSLCLSRLTAAKHIGNVCPDITGCYGVHD
jgi:hypothetical protein